MNGKIKNKLVSIVSELQHNLVRIYDFLDPSFYRAKVKSVTNYPNLNTVFEGFCYSVPVDHYAIDHYSVSYYIVDHYAIDPYGGRSLC